jgi:hypothetical protein
MGGKEEKGSNERTEERPRDNGRLNKIKYN